MNSKIFDCILSKINEILITLNKKSSNKVEEIILENDIKSFSNFKSLTFTTISGVIDRKINSNIIRFPVNNIIGSSYNSDDVIDTTIELDATNGKCLVTIIK